jgi:hypothetical protein
MLSKLDREELARAMLEQLVLYVQPSTGRAIVLSERPFNKTSDPNWVAVGPMGSQYMKRYTSKVAELRRTDLRVDWSDEIMSSEAPRRIALRLAELINESR